MKKHLFSILALLLMVATGAMAQNLNVRQLTRTADSSWVLNQMPDFDGQLEVTFYEQFRLDSIPLAWTIMVNGVDSSAGVTAYTEGDTTKGWLNILEGSFVELIPPTVVKPKVSNVTVVEASAPVVLTLDLATVTTDTTVGDGYTVTGTLGANVKISIADGATVTLDGVTINGVSNGSYSWAGINCLGDATIILSGTNTVKGFYEDYPGIHVPQNKTLTIQGSGSLTASSNGWGCGIGGGYGFACGNIVIAGGTITATGGGQAAGIGGGGNSASCGTISITGGTITANGGSGGAGIGGGQSGSCGNISITGGTINANGGENAPGIGSGNTGSCGDITITNGVTSVTATKGNNANYSIGAGNTGSCGTVTVGGNMGAKSDSPYTYPEAN